MAVYTLWILFLFWLCSKYFFHSNRFNIAAFQLVCNMLICAHCVCGLCFPSVLHYRSRYFLCLRVHVGHCITHHSPNEREFISIRLMSNLTDSWTNIRVFPVPVEKKYHFQLTNLVTQKKFHHLPMILIQNGREI